MRYFNFFVVISICWTSLTGCSSFKAVSDGYMVRGDENFTSPKGQLDVFLGPIITKELWESTETLPLKTGRAPKHQAKLLKTFGYNQKSPTTILFSNSKVAPYKLVVAISAIGNLDVREIPSKKRYTLDLARLEKKTTQFGKWYYEIKEIGNKAVYHAIIPVSEKLFFEKYLTLIYELPIGSDWTEFEKLLLENAQAYQSPGFYPSNMPLMDCGSADDFKQHEYVVPKAVMNKNKMFIVKAFKGDNVDDLVFFSSIISPPFTQGAFKLCPGNYTVQFTKLDGKIIQSYPVEISQ